MKNKIANGFFKTTILRKILSNWLKLALYQSKERKLKCIKFIHKKLMSKALTGLYIYKTKKINRKQVILLYFYKKIHKKRINEKENIRNNDLLYICFKSWQNYVLSIMIPQ